MLEHHCKPSVKLTYQMTYPRELVVCRAQKSREPEPWASQIRFWSPLKAAASQIKGEKILFVYVCVLVTL